MPASDLSVLSMLDSLESASFSSSFLGLTSSAFLSAVAEVSTFSLSLGVKPSSSCGFSSVFERLASLSVAEVSASTVFGASG